MMYFLEKVSINMQTAAVTKENLNRVYSMDREFKLKPMVINIKENSRQAKNTDRACILGLMAIIMTAVGKMV